MECPNSQREDVKTAFHATRHEGPWTECNGQVGANFYTPNSLPSVTLLPDLLTKIQVMMFAGAEDLICVSFAPRDPRYACLGRSRTFRRPDRPRCARYRRASKLTKECLRAESRRHRAHDRELALERRSRLGGQSRGTSALPSASV